ncbi:WD repeat-containing 24 [Brachionus plicatilis]|uniref:WD repeat-containing 24 n=1 Tax=Brachionus plicatilis TaxID=10195 RepID=A0A3M7STV6_BRAPC|nr:WD repeat-containing 24 [Brachionus plicatilis]
MCASCKITIKPGTQICKDCKKNAFLCSYCHLPVKRLYAWCNACCHGGHLSHMMKWFEANRKCPTGCGCTCSPNYINMEQNTSN